MEILIIKNNKTLLSWCTKDMIENINLKHNSELELVAKHINSDTQLKKTAIFILGNLFYMQDVVYAANNNLSKIDKAGSTILSIVRRIGYWICIIGCIIDIVKTLMQGDVKSISKIIMKYSLAFASLYIFPWILDLIKSVFA